MAVKKAKNYAPRRAKGLPRVAHEHVLTLPRNGRLGCALCPYVEPRKYKLELPDNMKKDKHAKGLPHPNNSAYLDHPTNSSQTGSDTDSESTGTSDSPSLTTDQLWALTVPKLYELAQEKRVPGRGKMNKEQLVTALSKR